MTPDKRNPSEPLPLDARTIARIRMNLLSVARAQAESIPSYNCFLNGLELGLSLVFEHQVIAEEILEACVTMGVEQLPYEPSRLYMRRAGIGRHRRVVELANLLIAGT